MKPKVKEWIARYGPAEVLSAVATVVCAVITYRIMASRIAAALVATWVGNIAYFGYILAVDIAAANATLKINGQPYTRTTFIKNIRALAVEFGFAEVLDSLLIRPALMYYFPVFTGSVWLGTLLAKFIADITFYLPAIVGYEYAKKRFRDFG